MNTRIRFRFLVGLLASVLAVMALTVGCFFALGAVLGLRFIGNEYHQELGDLTPLTFVHTAQLQVEKDLAFALEAWRKGKGSALVELDRPWVKAVWCYQGATQELFIHSASGTIRHEQVAPGEWLARLQGVLAQPLALGRILPCPTPGRDSSRAILPPMPVNASDPERVVVGETMMGGEASFARGLFLDREMLIRDRLCRLLRMEARDNYSFFRLGRIGQEPLFTVSHAGVFPGSFVPDSDPRKMAMGTQALSGILSGYLLETHTLRDFWGEEPTSNAVLAIVIVISLISGVVFGGLLYFYVQTRRSAQELELQNDWILNLAHTLRGPVHSLGVLLDAWETASPESRPPLLDMMHRELEHMDRANLRFIRLSRAARNRLALESQTVLLKPVVDQAANRLLARFPHYPGAGLRLAVPETLTVKADPEALREIVETALENALKYSSSGKPIDVAAREESGRIRLSVCDQGIGILAEDAARIGEAFFRGTIPGADGITGTGLGVYLARSLCGAMGGTYDLRSGGLNQGTLVTIALLKP